MVQGDVGGILFDKPMRLGHGHRQAAAHHDRQIDHVVTDKGALVFRHARQPAQFGISRAFIVYPLEIMVDTELLDAQADRRCVAAGDNRGLNAAVLQHLQTMPVQRVERFDFLAVVADENPPVGQHAVHIHNQQPDFGGTCLQFGRKGLHYDSFRRPKNSYFSIERTRRPPIP